MCQMLKRTQRYPALGCPCRICNSVLEIRAPETEASRQVGGGRGTGTARLHVRGRPSTSTFLSSRLPN